MFLGDSCKLIKSPSYGTCLREPPGGFCDVGCCSCFTSLEVFTFPGYFTLPPVLHLASQAPEDLHQIWALPFLLSVSSLFPGFSVTIYRKCCVFERRFLPTDVLYPALLPLIFAHFVTQTRAGTPHPVSSSACALTKLSFPGDAFSWTTHFVDARPLVLPIAPVSHVV